MDEAGVVTAAGAGVVAAGAVAGAVAAGTVVVAAAVMGVVATGAATTVWSLLILEIIEPICPMVEDFLGL